jgi:hypothetical protein
MLDIFDLHAVEMANHHVPRPSAWQPATRPRHQKARLRFHYRERNLELAQVASILFIAGTQEILAPVVATHAIFRMDDIQDSATYFPTIGAEVLEAPKPRRSHGPAHRKSLPRKNLRKTCY